MLDSMPPTTTPTFSGCIWPRVGDQLHREQQEREREDTSRRKRNEQGSHPRITVASDLLQQPSAASELRPSSLIPLLDPFGQMPLASRRHATAAHQSEYHRSDDRCD